MACPTWEFQLRIKSFVMRKIRELGVIFSLAKNEPCPIGVLRQHGCGDIDQHIESLLVGQPSCAHNGLGTRVVNGGLMYAHRVGDGENSGAPHLQVLFVQVPILLGQRDDGGGEHAG